MFTDFLASMFRFIFITAAVLFILYALPFVVAHAVETWDAPQYPHSGFTPECPEYIIE